VKVQFYWDRLGKRDADTSCWIRVGQYAAGQGFGACNLPRIGQEVIVTFLEGDPDQPIIVGIVYNAANMPPYHLPAQRTYAGVIHRSHHGVSKNASEICFQNQLGSELLRIHAETDSLTQAENNHLQQVGKVHKHEVGQYFHTIVGKPVNVNLAAVVPPAGVSGSGAGGGEPQDVPAEDDGVPAFATMTPPTGSGAGGGGSDPGTTTQTGALTQIYGDNATETYGNNRTYVSGNDDYKCDKSVTQKIGGDNSTDITGTDHYHATSVNSSVPGVTNIFEGMENSLILDQNEIKIVHFESNIIHIALDVMKIDGEIFSKEGVSLKMFSMG
jgi:hypothetical protein